MVWPSNLCLAVVCVVCLQPTQPALDWSAPELSAQQCELNHRIACDCVNKLCELQELVGLTPPIAAMRREYEWHKAFWWACWWVAWPQATECDRRAWRAVAEDLIRQRLAGAR